MVVALNPPFEARRIDVEADLEEMEGVGIRGADVLLRHRLYGKPTMETVRFRAAKPEPYQEQPIYVDKDNSEVEYEVILTHAKEGTLPHSEWTKWEDNFIDISFSELPAKYLKQREANFPEVKEALEEPSELIEKIEE